MWPGPIFPAPLGGADTACGGVVRDCTGPVLAGHTPDGVSAKRHDKAGEEIYHAETFGWTSSDHLQVEAGGGNFAHGRGAGGVVDGAQDGVEGEAVDEYRDGEFEGLPATHKEVEGQEVEPGHGGSEGCAQELGDGLELRVAEERQQFGGVEPP